MMKYPIILSPIAKSRVWGGERLSALDAEPPIGEHWVLSVRGYDSNTVQNGEFEGKRLDLLLEEHPEFLGSKCPSGRFPLLIKFIDSRESLSIQVHPDDEVAAKISDEGGKTEMWYIVDADPDSFIYLGMKDNAEVDELCSTILAGGDPTPFLNKVKVKAGECYFIAGGTPHAIGGGNYICEIQQNCDTTYRMYDYGRPRELHPIESVMSIKKRNIPEPTCGGILADCKYFTSILMEVDGELTLSAMPDRFVSLTVIGGEGVISVFGENVLLGERDSVFIPAGREEYTLLGQMKIIKTTI